MSGKVCHMVLSCELQVYDLLNKKKRLQILEDAKQLVQV